MNETSEKVYLKLIQLPQKEWPGIIENLDKQVKKDLLLLLRRKRLKRAVSSEKKEEVFLSASNKFCNNNQSLPLTAKCSSVVTTERGTNGHESQLDVCSITTQREEEETLSPSCYRKIDELNRVTGTCRHEMACVKQVPLIPYNSIIRLVGVKDLMYVSGDTYEVKPECESLIQRYLYCWFSMVLKVYYSVYFQKVKDEESVERSSKRSKFLNLVGFFESLFPQEFSSYQTKMQFHHQARSSILCSFPLVSDSSLLDQLQLLPDVKFFKTDTPLCSDSKDCEKGSIDNNHKSSLLRNELHTHLQSTTRFAERLKVQDIRTQNMNAVEYRRFTKARESFSRRSSKSISSWVDSISRCVYKTMSNTLVSSVSPEHQASPQNSSSYASPALRLNLSPSTIKFLLFLVSDRLASIVELALRIRFFLCNTQDVSLDIKQDPNSFLDPNLFLNFYSQGLRLPTLLDVVSKDSKRNLTTTTAAKTKPCEPVDLVFYHSSITFYLELVDQEKFQIDTSTVKKEILSSDSNNILKDLSSSCFLESQSKCPQNMEFNVALRFMKNTKLNLPIETNVIELMGNSSRSGQVPSDVDTFFDCVVRQAMEGFDKQVIPEEIVVYAFVKCRDLFWTHRHQPSHEVWKSIYERYRLEKDSASPSYTNFCSTYIKMTKYLTAFHEILSFQFYFKSLLNIDDKSSFIDLLHKKYSGVSHN